MVEINWLKVALSLMESNLDGIAKDCDQGGYNLNNGYSNLQLVLIMVTMVLFGNGGAFTTTAVASATYGDAASATNKDKSGSIRSRFCFWLNRICVLSLFLLQNSIN